MYKYKFKDIYIQAFRVGEEKEPDWILQAIEDGSIERYSNNELAKYYVLGPFTTLIVDVGDYIIRTNKNTIYPLKPYIFNELFVEI